jgi:hypothetical protein
VEALKEAIEAVIIATVMMMTTVLTTVATPYVQSQQSTSSVVTVIAAETTLLMAGQIFCDFLISTHSKKLSIHESTLSTLVWVVPMLLCATKF